MRALSINTETTMFTSAVPIPIIGVLPVNAYLIRGEQPTLIDAGITPEQDEFVAAVKEPVDLGDLQWIVITHADRDHTGASCSCSPMLRTRAGDDIVSVGIRASATNRFRRSARLLVSGAAPSTSVTGHSPRPPPCSTTPARSLSTRRTSCSAPTASERRSPHPSPFWWRTSPRSPTTS